MTKKLNVESINTTPISISESLVDSNLVQQEVNIKIPNIEGISGVIKVPVIVPPTPGPVNAPSGSGHAGTPQIDTSWVFAWLQLMDGKVSYVASNSNIVAQVNAILSAVLVVLLSRVDLPNEQLASLSGSLLFSALAVVVILINVGGTRVESVNWDSMEEAYKNALKLLTSAQRWATRFTIISLLLLVVTLGLAGFRYLFSLIH